MSAISLQTNNQHHLQNNCVRLRMFQIVLAHRKKTVFKYGNEHRLWPLTTQKQREAYKTFFLYHTDR